MDYQPKASKLQLSSRKVAILSSYFPRVRTTSLVPMHPYRCKTL